MYFGSLDIWAVDYGLYKITASSYETATIEAAKPVVANAEHASLLDPIHLHLQAYRAL